MINTNEKAWIYNRSATGENNALQKQSEAAHRFAIAHNFTVVSETSDIGNGLKYDHPGLSEMLSSVKSGKVSTVVMRDISRIGRDVVKTLNIIRNDFEAHGVTLSCYTK